MYGGNSDDFFFFFEVGLCTCDITAPSSPLGLRQRQDKRSSNTAPRSHSTSNVPYVRAVLSSQSCTGPKPLLKEIPSNDWNGCVECADIDPLSPLYEPRNSINIGDGYGNHTNASTAFNTQCFLVCVYTLAENQSLAARTMQEWNKMFSSWQEKKFQKILRGYVIEWISRQPNYY